MNDNYQNIHFWDQNIIKELVKKNEQKKVGFLFWDENPDNITNQIKWLIRNNVEIIISEILPDEVPDETLNKEYQYIEKKIIFLPPNLKLNKETSNKKEHKRILITEKLDAVEEKKINEFIWFIEKNNIVKVIEIEDNIPFIIEILSSAEEIIFNISNPVLCHYAELIKCEIGIDIKYTSEYKPGSPFRYLTSNINYRNSNFLSESMSLRGIAEFFIKEQKKELNGNFKFEYVKGRNDSKKEYSRINSNKELDFIMKELFSTKEDEPIENFQSTNFIKNKEYLKDSSKKAKYYATRYRLLSIKRFLELHDKIIDKSKTIDIFVDQILDQLCNFIVEQKPHWTLKLWISNFILNTTFFNNIINRILNRFKISYSNSKDTTIGEFGFIFINISRDENISHETRKEILEIAIKFFSLSKAVNCKFYAKCYDFIILLNSKAPILNNEFSEFFNRKSKTIEAKILVKLIPLFLNNKEISVFIKNTKICATDLIDGFLLAHNISDYELNYNFYNHSKNYDILNDAYNFISSIDLKYPNLNDLYKLKIILNKNDDININFLTKETKFSLIVFSISASNILLIRKLSNDLINTQLSVDELLSLTYLLYINNYEDYAIQFASRINESLIEKFTINKNFLYLFVSLYYKIKNNKSKYIYFFNKSEAHNPCHSYLLHNF